MRRQLLVLGLIIALAPLAEPAAAQFFSPRAFLGVVTRPLRGLLGHHGVSRHHSRVHEARPATSPQGSDQRQAKRDEVAPGAIPKASRSLKPMDPQNPYEIVLGYVFWPNEFERDYSRYSYRTIVMAVIGAPAAAAQATVGSAGDLATAGQNAGALKAVNDLLPACDITGDSAGNWLFARLENTLRPDPQQEHAIDALQSQLVEGTEAIRSHCRATKTGTPTERLADLKARFWALHDANLIARPAIKDLYETLTDQQRAKLKGPAARVAHNDSNGANIPMGQRYQACAAHGAGETERLIDEIAKATQPTQGQQASLDNLRNRSSQMEKLLLAACTQPIPNDPPARLDAADDKLVAMNFAVSNLEIALNGFYGSLDRRQKATFDALGR